MTVQLPDQIWRDHSVDGDPSTPEHRPLKADIRSWAKSLYSAADYRAWGTGSTGITAAIAAVAARGGGAVAIPESVTVTGKITGLDKVRLIVPRGVTLTGSGTIDASGAIIEATDAPDFGVGGFGRIDAQGAAQYAVKIDGASRYPIDGLEIVNSRGGVRLEANATSGIGRVALRDLYVHDNFVHPTSPATLSLAGHALSISCRPSLGYDLTEYVDLAGICLEGVAAGATNGLNQFTKDLLSVQGAKVLFGDRIIARKGGEVGISATFGCQFVTLIRTLVEQCDGHGMTLSGAHYRIDVENVTGDFTVGETVTGDGSGASGTVEYWINKGDGTGVLWVQTPSREKIVAGDEIEGGASLETADVTASWFARTFDVEDGIKTWANGLDAGSTGTEFAGINAQHCEDAYLGGKHVDNNKFGIKVNSCDFRLGDFDAPISGTQLAPFNDVGSSEDLGRNLSPLEIADLYGASGDDQDHSGVRISGDRSIDAAQNDGVIARWNRTGSTTTALGDVLTIARNGVETFKLGTNGIQFPQNTDTGAFSHSSLPGASGTTRKVNLSTSSRGGSLALVRSDGTNHIDIVTGLVSRATAWTLSAIGAVSGAIVGGMTYVTDAIASNPAISVWSGSRWWHIPVHAPNDTDTIGNGTSSEAITFTTALASASYTVTVTPLGDPGTKGLWVTSKTSSGFTVNRDGTSGDLDFDWQVKPAQDP